MSDSDSDNDAEIIKSNVELGFLECTPSWKLQSRFFPSKVGSKPAWLALSQDIPSYEDLLCSSCDQPLIFLLQLYAPIEENENCFHRMLYIFICKTNNCVKSNSESGFRVYRNQLPRKNKYYPFDPPVEEESWSSDICAEKFGINLCQVCGTRSTNHCGNCKKVFYCSKDHQVHDWKAGHKKICKENAVDHTYSNNILFKEHEIITESESTIIKEYEESDEVNSSEVTKDKGTLQDVQCEEELAKMAFSEEDVHFIKFRNQINYAPEQVIRYELNGTPLWVTDNNIPVLDKVEDCHYCGGNRIYEFQILPQLLNYLGLDDSQSSLDWGTLIIFTCENNCNSGKDYKLEYLIKQDISVNKKK